MKKEENSNSNVVKEKKSFKETITLMIRKKWLTNTTQTIILIAILVCIFLAINLYIQDKELPEIDVTENKIYTLSNASKDVISKIDEDIKIYIYGIEEDTSIVNFIKQYTRVNEHITYEILTEQSNLAKVQEFDLSDGYQIIVLETGDSTKIIDVGQFHSYDYTTGQEVDLTEQTLTNSLLGITAANKPNVYFTEGHTEYDLEKALGVVRTYLENEAYNVQSVNLLTTGKVPDDCNLLVICRPTTDFLESEVNAVIDYINKGGDLIISSDFGNLPETYTNLTKVYDLYGVSLEHTGYIYEQDNKKLLNGYPAIFIPELSSSNDITADIYSDGKIWLAYSGRLNFKSESELEELHVKRDDIMKSSEKSLFIKDLTKTVNDAVDSAERGESTIASVLTKTITTSQEATECSEVSDSESEIENSTETTIDDAINSSTDDSEENTIESKLLIMASSTFITDYIVDEITTEYPISYLANNKDFMLNAVAELTSRDNTLKIRKDMSTSTYQPTAEQDRIVVTIVFAVPIIIIFIGIVVWNTRRRKK